MHTGKVNDGELGGSGEVHKRHGIDQGECQGVYLPSLCTKSIDQG